MSTNDPITHEWLKSIGFRWAEWDRSGGKHWLLWFGGLHDEPFSSAEDLGIEVAEATDPKWGWNCWLRSDFSRKYARFIHIRHIHTQLELRTLVVALSGQPWEPGNHLYGSIRTEREAEYLRRTETRADRAIMKGDKWTEDEKDESAARVCEF